MKRIYFLLLLLTIFCNSNAQIAKWLIQPKYKYMQLVPNTTIYKGGNNDSTFLWNLQGKVLLSTKHYIGPFVGDVALVADRNELKGIVNTTGKFIPVGEDQGIIEIDSKYPFFSCGYLLVKKNNQYYFIDKSGSVAFGPFKDAYPFYGGKTSVVAYENPGKLKGEIHALLRTDGSYVDFIINGKKVGNGNVTFCSIPNEQNKSIVVIKKDVYVYDEMSKLLTRLSTDGTQNKKSYVSLFDNDFIKNTSSYGNSVVKLNQGQLCFDANNLLIKIELEGLQPVVFQRSHVQGMNVERFLTTNKSEDSESFGLDWIVGETKKQILPPQFSVVTDIIASNAVVCLNGSYGVVTLDPSSNFIFTLNNGDDIGFTHAKYSTNVQVAIPNYISWQNVIMGTDKKQECEIIPVSRTGSDTKEGNFLKYDCNLFIPKNLTENRTPLNYHFYLDYDGLRSPLYAVSTNAWHIQQYDMTIGKTWTDRDTAYVEIYVNRKTENAERSYWFTVGCSSENVCFSTKTVKIDENKYIVKLFDLKDCDSRINFEIKEDKCPPIIFECNMVYVGPSIKSKGRFIVTKVSK